MIRRRSLVMRMLSVLEISFFAIADSCLAVLVLGHFRDMVEGVAAICRKDY